MRKLLIADDESGIRSLVRMTLERDEYQILEASDGQEALALAREHHPEVVLLDVMMPGLSGFDVCRTLKDDPATAKTTVVMLTAKAQESDREQGIAAGADDYFTKPFSPIALLRKIDTVYGEQES
jgi:two-component system phosphate regulon response regulator PhoB